MSLTALEWGLRAPITPRFGGNLGALPRLQGTEPKQQQKSDLKHKNSDRSLQCMRNRSGKTIFKISLINQKSIFEKNRACSI